MTNLNFEKIYNINENYLKVNVDKDSIDDISLKVATHNCPDFLLPFVTAVIDGKYSFKYNVGNMLSVEYCDKKLTKANYIRFVKGILIPLMKCDEWFMDYHHFYFDPKYVFVNRSDFSIKYIYCFSNDYVADDDEIKKYIRSTINSIDITDDNKLQLELCHVLLSDNYTLKDIMDLINKFDNPIIEKNAGEQISHTAPSVLVSSSIVPAKTETNSEKLFRDKPTPTPQTPSPVKKDDPVSSELGSDELDMLFDDSNNSKTRDKWSLKNIFKSSGKKRSIQSEDTSEKSTSPQVNLSPSVSEPIVISNNLSDSEETQFFGIENEKSDEAAGISLSLVKSSVDNVPKLIRLDFVNKDYVTIGRTSKDKSYKSDYELPAEAKKIGRQHIRIEKRGNEYYVIDLATLNHTFLNGEMIFANQAVLLENGSTITFANDIITYKVVIK